MKKIALALATTVLVAVSAAAQQPGSSVGPVVDISQPARTGASSGVQRTNPIDSVMSGGSSGSLPSSSVQFDICSVDDTQKGCANYCTANPAACATNGGGSGGGSAQYALVGRCGLGINTPTGTSLNQSGAGFSDRQCVSESLVWIGATSGQLFQYFEVGDTGLNNAGFYAVWEKSKSTDWSYQWSGACSTVVTWRCFVGNTSAGIGSRYQNEMSVVVTHKTTGEKHTVTFSANMYICGARIGNQRYGCG